MPYGSPDLLDQPVVEFAIPLGVRNASMANRGHVRSGPLGTPSVRVAHDDPHPARNGARARAGSAYYISRGRALCACSARPEDAGPGFLASSAGAMLPTQLRAASRNAACRAPRVFVPSSRRCRAISRRIADIHWRPVLTGRGDDPGAFFEAASCQRDIGGDTYVDSRDVFRNPVVGRVCVVADENHTHA